LKNFFFFKENIIFYEKRENFKLKMESDFHFHFEEFFDFFQKEHHFYEREKNLDQK
jgi:hypothetical protein